MRKDLLNSLEKRFGELVGENDIFMLSTMLDPNFGKGAIPRSELGLAMARLKDRLIKNSSRPIVTPENENKNSSSSEQNLKNNYNYYGDEEEMTSPIDDLDSQISLKSMLSLS